MNKIKIRSIINDDGSTDKYVDFYPAVFEQRSKLIYEDGKFFFEIIERGAFTKLFAKNNLNVKANINHDDNKLLGRSKSGTLQLELDDYGLKASVRVGNSTLWNDTLDAIERGDLFESSFKFRNNKNDESVSRDENGELIKRIKKISGLYDVSIVDDGAYPNTNIDIRLRSINEFIQEENDEKERKESIKEEIKNYRNYLNELKNTI